MEEFRWKQIDTVKLDGSMKLTSWNRRLFLKIDWNWDLPGRIGIKLKEASKDYLGRARSEMAQAMKTVLDKNRLSSQVEIHRSRSDQLSLV